MAAYFHALGEISRLKLILAIDNDAKNVSQLCAATGLSQANVSKHLKIMTDCGMLVRRKEGVFVLYAVTTADVLKLCEMGGASLRRHTGESTDSKSPAQTWK